LIMDNQQRTNKNDCWQEMHKFFKKFIERLVGHK
jgi:hypothetical protein